MLNDIIEGIYAQIKDMADNGYIDINQICIKDESACKNFADYYAIEMDNIMRILKEPIVTHCRTCKNLADLAAWSLSLLKIYKDLISL